MTTKISVAILVCGLIPAIIDKFPALIGRELSTTTRKWLGWLTVVMILLGAIGTILSLNIEEKTKGLTITSITNPIKILHDTTVKLKVSKGVNYKSNKAELFIMPGSIDPQLAFPPYEKINDTTYLIGMTISVLNEAVVKNLKVRMYLVRKVRGQFYKSINIKDESLGTATNKISKMFQQHINKGIDTGYLRVNLYYNDFGSPKINTYSQSFFFLSGKVFDKIGDLEKEAQEQFKVKYNIKFR